MIVLDEDLLPLEQDVQFYEENGWYISKPILEAEVLERTREALSDHQAGRRDQMLPEGIQCGDWFEGDGDGVRNNEFCSLQTVRMRELAWNPMVAAIAARLARTSQIRLFDDQAIHKPPYRSASEAENASVVGWHTDHSYWSTCTSKSMLTAWMPLDSTTSETGTLTVISGSHRWTQSEHIRGFNNADLNGLEEIMGRSIPEASIVPLQLKQGQVSFHHMRTLHGSSSNVSAKPRIAIAVHLQDKDNCYQSFKTPEGKEVVIPHDQLCRRTADGIPDYSDPEVFPVLWPAESA